MRACENRGQGERGTTRGRTTREENKYIPGELANRRERRMEKRLEGERTTGRPTEETREKRGQHKKRDFYRLKEERMFRFECWCERALARTPVYVTCLRVHV